LQQQQLADERTAGQRRESESERVRECERERERESKREREREPLGDNKFNGTEKIGNRWRTDESGVKLILWIISSVVL
jgi:hypothetical protein